MSSVGSKLDANQVLKQVYDELNNRLRVDATVTASVGDVSVVDSDGDEWSINPDGSGNMTIVNPLAIEIDAADGDNIAISDGTNTLPIAVDGSTAPTKGLLALGIDGSSNAQIIKTDADGELQIDILSSVLPTGAATSVLQTTGNTSLNSIDSKTPALGAATIANSTPVNIASDQVVPISATTLPLPTGAATSSLQTSGNASLTSIDGKLNSLGQKTMSGSVPVVLPSDQSLTIDEPVKISGSIDGSSGTEYGIVYNRKQQILDSHDRLAAFTYADFGTKNERVTRIDYTSATFPGNTARVDYSYTLVSGSYRRDSETWTII